MGSLKVEKNNKSDGYKVYVNRETKVLTATVTYKRPDGTVQQMSTSINIVHPGVAIYIAFPDYEADPEIEIPLPKGKTYKVPKIPTGHAGVLLIENNGVTSYYEFGRYPHSWDKTKGYVRKKTIPNIEWEGKGLIKISELNKVLKKISNQSGHNGNITGAYIETKNINEMILYAEKKHIESVPDNINDPDLHKNHAKDFENIDSEYDVDRDDYNLLRNNCGTFAMDVIKADDDIKAPWFVIDTSPNEIVKEFFDEDHKKVVYDSKTKTTKVE